ncbi:sigma 54-interacting transcriptional regulator [Fusibacter paucivorans]|uniref:HTH-type transcriptional regulatory protein TyrR n=1 Tax=Fusibacter paucivorans TaxID=76009 RepID=A0ABS5PPE3_9FIRM|nr:sigma 54-interacting transcriptional regulator [Fusibacter paucivorans]MBS7526456.1 sigma 54-interacting transcriptional regulator [Fusibacter paucivorans]
MNSVEWNLSINLQDILDVLELPTHIIDHNGIVVAVNDKWVKHIGVSKEEAIGFKINDVLRSSMTKFYFSIDYDADKDDSEQNVTHFKEALKDSVALKVLETKTKIAMFTYSAKHETKHNKMLVTSTPILRDNKVCYVVTTLANVTESIHQAQQLEKEIQKNEMILEELNYYKMQQVSPKIVGNSPEIKKIKDYIAFVSKANVTVLITGESGVGKEVFANEIYRNSHRADKAFVKINCASIPDNLIESELFGYEKGAFTGANKTKIGLFEVADQGTILLDEIGELPLNLQSKLLRVLQEMEIMRIGGKKPIKIDVRVIASTNVDLYQSVQNGLFRSDLFYRLNVIPIHIPALRGRSEDIPELADYFVEKFNRKYSKLKSLSDDAIMLLKNYQWPGNIREMENLLERIVIIGSKDKITQADLRCILYQDEAAVAETADLSYDEALEAFDRKLIEDSLHKYGSTYKAAEHLHTTQSKIARKAKKYNILW